MTSTVISVENLSKAYPIYKKPVDMFLEILTRKTRHDLFWALRDVSFSVKAGQRLGIIGPNGAGKSTLLQIVAGNLQPTSGTVDVNGSISALLSLAPAWNNEESGIENIRFNLLMRGCNHSEVDEFTDEIIDFAELGQFIYQPVKTYSSGMSARLAFAIGTAISPEILIVDEVLSVGDGYFAGKAIRRMKAMCDRGKALLFVSHSTAAVRQMCETAIWMENGTIRLIGPVDYVTTKYDEDMARSDDETVRPANIQRAKKKIRFAAPDEIGAPETVRLRLRSSESVITMTTRYIREIKVRWKNDSKTEIASVSLEAAENQPRAYLDVKGCEWGRIYTHHGYIVRTLVHRTGARKGGHFLIDRPTEYSSQAWPIEVEWIQMAEDEKPELILEYIDLEKAVWKPFEIKSSEELSDGWTRFAAAGTIPPATRKVKEQAVAIASKRQLSPIQIVDVIIATENGQTNAIIEKEPFSIQVRVECIANAPSFCMCIQIDRSDGVYMFWQPSDFHQRFDTTGVKFVSIYFYFDENYFPSGDYDVTATAITGPWHKDVVQSEIEVFDRKTSVARFSVLREIKNLQFGALNYRARVEIEKTGNIYESSEKTQFEKASSAAR